MTTEVKKAEHPGGLGLALDFGPLLIFFLNYIPTVGSIIAVALPSLFALVQFPHVMPALFIALGISFWQFVIGNVLAPRMTGKSLNLSPLVVLLALAIWGSISCSTRWRAACCAGPGQITARPWCTLPIRPTSRSLASPA